MLFHLIYKYFPYHFLPWTHGMYQHLYTDFLLFRRWRDCTSEREKKIEATTWEHLAFIVGCGWVYSMLLYSSSDRKNSGVALEEASWTLCTRSSHLLVFIVPVVKISRTWAEEVQLGSLKVSLKFCNVFLSYLEGTIIFRSSSLLHFWGEDCAWLDWIKVISSLGSD